MEQVNPVRETTFKVIEKATEVKINQENIYKLALEWRRQNMPEIFWNRRMHLRTDDESQLLTYLIVLDSLNWLFWNPNGQKWQINYKGQNYTEYFALSLALKDFFEKHPDKANLEYFSQIPYRKFQDILQGGKNFLYLMKRWEIVRWDSQAILSQGGPKNFVLLAKHKFSELIRLIMNLPSFYDVTHYDHKESHSYFEVYLLKRAQILAVDIYGAFNGQGIGYFEDLDYPTAFPDYKLPQVLEHWGILEYSPALREKIKNKIIIPSSSKEEVEIRSATVWAVEYLKKELAMRGMQFYSFEIDWLLWEASQNEEMLLPHHYTHTTAY